MTKLMVVFKMVSGDTVMTKMRPSDVLMLDDIILGKPCVIEVSHYDKHFGITDVKVNMVSTHITNWAVGQQEDD